MNPRSIVQLQSLTLQISRLSKAFLDIQATIDCGFTLKRVHDMIRTYSLVKSSDLNKKIATLATKVELKAEQDKIMKLEAFDSINVHGKMFFGDDSSQNIFAYQPTPDTLELKKDKSTDYVNSWKSKEVYTSKLKLSRDILRIKRFGCKVGIKSDKDPLAVEQTNYVTKILNAYIVYDLHAWPTVPFDNLKLKNCFFGATNIVKNSDKER